jgi:acetyl esterase
MPKANPKYPQLTDPGIRTFLEVGEKLYPADAVNFTMAEQRAFYDKYCAYFAGRRPSGLHIEDFRIGDISCRRYTPANSKATLLYLHGGGFAVGGLDSHDSICADLADQAKVEVTAVEYRLAPEHPFPAALDDCWIVLQSLNSCIVAGDSAGGNLAAALCLKSRDAGGPTVKGQVLIYPGLGGDVTKGSYVTQANAPGLSTKDTLYYRDVYRGNGHKYAEPLRETNFAGLPPAFLVAAHHDPLHDDCEAYAQKLRAAGVRATVRDELQLVHAFLRARTMSEPAAKSFAAIVAAIRGFAT